MPYNLDDTSHRFPFASLVCSDDVRPVACCLEVSECYLEREVASHNVRQQSVGFLLPSSLETASRLGTVFLACLPFFRRSPFQTFS